MTLLSTTGKQAILGTIHPQKRAGRDAPYRLGITGAGEVNCHAKRTPPDLRERSMRAIVIGDFSRIDPTRFDADLVLEGASATDAAALIDIFDFLHPLVESQAKAFDILEEFGVDTKIVVLENPYRIVEVDGVGFKTADKAARQIWGEPFDRMRTERLAAALALAVEDQCIFTGSTVVQRAAAISAALGPKLLDLPMLAATRGALDEIIPELITKERLAQHGSGAAVGMTRFIRSEETVARIVNQKIGLIEGPRPGAYAPYTHPKEAIRRVAQVTKGLPFTLADSQREALGTLLTSPIGVLTGGPGTGKTTITRVFCDVHEANGKSVVLVAPTGRAAQRLSESTGREASTIHRAFMIGPNGRAKMTAQNPLPCDVLVVDEASMLDAGLARTVLNGVPSSTLVLFVGDADQLPSIMPGNVLADLLATPHVPRAQLTQVMRQAEGSDIIKAARQFNAGKGIPRELSGENDFLYVEAAGDDEALEYVRRLMDGVFPEIAKKDGSPIDPLRDVQILCTHNDKGPIARWNVSQFYNSLANPLTNRAKLRSGGNSKNSGFANPDEMVGIGDKVISLKNDYDLGVMNGEIGFVASMKTDRGDVDSLTVEFDPAPGDVEINEPGDYGSVPKPRLVTFSGKTLKNVTAAGAITVHKSQGSQFPAVICLVPRSAGSFVSRRLIYTAMTRAQQFLAVIGVRDACDLASREVGSPRTTTLPENLMRRVAQADAAE